MATTVPMCLSVAEITHVDGLWHIDRRVVCSLSKPPRVYSPPNRVLSFPLHMFAPAALCSFATSQQGALLVALGAKVSQSQEELEAAFAKIDADRDGGISADEFVVRLLLPVPRLGCLCVPSRTASPVRKRGGDSV